MCVQNKSSSSPYYPDNKPLSDIVSVIIAHKLMKVKTIGCSLSHGMFGQKKNPQPLILSVLNRAFLTPDGSLFQHGRTLGMVEGVALSV